MGLGRAAVAGRFRFPELPEHIIGYGEIPSALRLESSESTSDDMSTVKTQLMKILTEDVESPGTFAASEVVPMPVAGLRIDGMMLGMPIMQVPELVAASTVAPFGKGLETVMDESVRKAREIDAGKIQVAEKFGALIQEVAKGLAAKLGVSDRVDVEARLYKLALYETGGFFKTHQDTERSEGNFASLVLQLPCEHQGGALVVRRGTEEKRFEDGSLDSFLAVAFWADMDHEVEVVTSGNRVCLLYNLVRTGSGPAPSLNDFETFKAKLRAVANDWWTTGSCPKVAIKLEHYYTPTNLPRLAALKGNDRAMVEALVVSDTFDVYLALVTKHESGEPEQNYDGSEYYGRPDNGRDSDMAEVYDTSVRVSKGISIDGDDATSLLQSLRIDFENDVVTNVDDYDDEDEENEGPLFDEDDEPDEREYEGYTGNAGPSLDFYYHKAVAIVWPKQYTVEILCSVNVDAVIRILNRDLTTLQQALDYAPASKTSQHADKFLSAAVLHGDIATAKQVLQYYHVGQSAIPSGISTKDRAEAVVEAMEKFASSSPSDDEEKPFEESVLDLIRMFPSHTDPLVTLALALHRNGFQDQAHNIARIIVAAVDKRAFLTPHKKDIAGHVFEMLAVLRLTDVLEEWHDALQTASASVLAAILVRLPRDVDQQLEALVATLYITALPKTTTKDAEEHCPDVFQVLVRSKPDLLAQLIQIVMAMDGNNEILRATLCCSSFISAFRDAKEASNSAVVDVITDLARSRVAQIGTEKPQVSSSWHQRNAHVPNHPVVTQFLRGPERSMVYTGVFENIRHARNFAAKHFNGYYNSAEHHSATAEARGSGGNAHVIITKTTHADERAQEGALRQFQDRQTERRRILRDYSLETSIDLTHDLDENEEGNRKRQRRETSDVIDLTSDDG